MNTGTTYDTTKHQFDGLPNEPSTCRYCKQSFASAIHQKPEAGSDENWIAKEGNGHRYPLNMNVYLNGPTLIYIDTEGNPIQLSLNNYQVQDIINDWNDQPNGDLEEGMKPHVLNPPQGHVAEYAPAT